MDDTQPRMTWTTDAPTKAGWYWWRRERGEPYIVEVRQQPEGLYVPCEGFVSHLTGEWHGPLEVPA